MTLAGVLLPALLPVVLDGLKALFSGIFGNVKPLTVQDQIALKQADAEMMKGIAQMDALQLGQQVSLWVSNLRAANRYLLADAIIGSTILLLFLPSGHVPVSYVNSMLDLTASVFSFMFGDRVYLHLKK